MSNKQTLTWYCVTMDQIEPFEITRFTDKMVFFLRINGKETRRNRLSDFDNYFPTREEAKSFLVEKCKKGVFRAERDLTMARNRLRKAEAL